MQSITNLKNTIKKYSNPNSGNFIVVDRPDFKHIVHKDLSLKFRKSDGYTVMEGNNEDTYSPVGAFICDIEATTICHGVPQADGTKKLCEFCYKNGNPNGTYMTIDTYKTVLNNLNQNNTITQVALGVDAEAKTNPDLEAILAYTRSVGIVPNLTVAALDDETAQLVAKYCGATAVSVYDCFDTAFDTIKKLTDLGMNQINIHRCIYEENFDETMSIIDAIGSDPRLAKLNAIVFLSLKQKGRGIGYQRLSDEKFQRLYDRCIDDKIRFGMDSCSSHRFLEAAKKYGNHDDIVDYVEPCESYGQMSSYCNVDGHYFPCSFVEGALGWETGIDLTRKDLNFLDDVWYSPKLSDYRARSLACGRKCLHYKI
jgi:hypothetical protein